MAAKKPEARKPAIKATGTPPKVKQHPAEAERDALVAKLAGAKSALSGLQARLQSGSKTEMDQAPGALAAIIASL